MRRAPVGLLLLVAWLATACVHERERVVGVIPEGALGPPRSRDVADGGRGEIWAARAFARPAVRSSPLVGRDRAAGIDAVVADVPAPPAERPALAPTSEPVRPSHRPIPATTSLEALAREKFLSAPTELVCQRATLYVPTAYAGEVTLSGGAVTDDGPGRRSATGGAVATWRRLRVRADELKVVVRATSDDVQVSARGGVSFRSDQPASVIDETGLRSLLLTNDGYTPLR